MKISDNRVSVNDTRIMVIASELHHYICNTHLTHSLMELYR